MRRGGRQNLRCSRTAPRYGRSKAEAHSPSRVRRDIIRVEFQGLLKLRDSFIAASCAYRVEVQLRVGYHPKWVMLQHSFLFDNCFLRAPQLKQVIGMVVECSHVAGVEFEGKVQLFSASALSQRKLEC